MTDKKEFLNQKAVLYSPVNERGLLHPPVFLEGSIVLMLLFLSQLFEMLIRRCYK